MTVRLLGASEIRRLASELDVTPTKKLGQNFVVDANTVRRIVAKADVEPGDVVVEVGPGLGSLTLGLLEAGAHVVAIEIDRRLASRLAQTVAESVIEPSTGEAPTITVVAEDALTVRELPATPTVLVANLPYNVSVPVLLHLLETFDSLTRGLVMVQAEVGRRLAAAPGSKIYGVPSIKAAWYADVREAGPVSRRIFWPEPNVDSILVRLDRHEPLGDESQRRETFALVDAAFQQRRKMLRQSLSSVLGSEASAIIEEAGLDPTARGEQLTVHDYLAIAEVHRSR